MQYTEDSIWSKEIRILQPRSGYRFALDAVLLAHFVKAKTGDRLLEIGAGSGVVSILISRLNQFQSLTAVEIQKELADLCRKNFESNHLQNANVLEADIKDVNKEFPDESFEVIFSNPPYRKAGSGRLNPLSQKAIARHEIKMQLKDLFDCAQKLLIPAGHLTIILPAFRESDFRQFVASYEFQIHEWRFVHSFAGTTPAFFLATAGKSSDEFVEYPPLIIYTKPGEYTHEMESLLTGAS